jgi:hypothetical protein
MNWHTYLTRNCQSIGRAKFGDIEKVMSPLLCWHVIEFNL